MADANLHCDCGLMIPKADTFWTFGEWHGRRARVGTDFRLAFRQIIAARRTFCLAGRALKAARRTWLSACRIPMLSCGHGNSARRTGTAARGLRITVRRVLRAARGVGMLARRLRSAARGAFDLASRHCRAARRDQLLDAHIRYPARRTRSAVSGPLFAVFSASSLVRANKKGVPLARNAFVHGAVSGPQAEAASGG